MRDGASGRSRGFGFLTFKDARTVNIVMVKEHYLDGKIVKFLSHSEFTLQSSSQPSSPKNGKKTSSHIMKIDPKRAIPRDEQERTSKIFVGGVSQEATEQDFKEFFMKFGRVVDATLMMDKDTGRPRGFGFVTFDSEAAVDSCLEQPLEILGKPIEVKKAQPRGNMREEEEARGGARGNRFQKRGMDDNQNMNNQAPQGGGNQMAPGGMTPQLMAQYWQRMQQYFAMMQQQMAMGRGMPGMPAGMNPMMMQQMQAMAMQNQMQGGGGGGGGGRSQSPSEQGAGMGGMNAQMQQQMMQQMQGMQGMGGGAGSPNGATTGNNYQAGGGSNPGGNIGTPGYNAYEQQMFEQQKYEQQSMRRAQRDQSGYGGGGNGGGGGGYGGGPTSWEGMYDDVPQPDVPSGGGRGGRGGYGGGRGGSNRGSAPPQNGPVSTPPANAPTGPKNAGRPGANYRGGGRGGNRGFHPYARG